MEFLKRKYFSLRITMTILLIASLVHGNHGLQGFSTWMCLGLHSPFIKFNKGPEVLANNSIPLNITKDEQALMHQEGLRKLGTFIKPVDLRDSATGFVKANLTKNITFSQSGPPIPRRLHPIQEEMDQKQIILLDEDTDENGLPASLTDEDRKFIVPMALKNASPDPRAQLAGPRTTSTTTHRPATTKKTVATTKPEFASNIDDLKNHILFLQNLTKHDSTFQSKFVVFPSLQKDKPKQSPTPTTTARSVKPLLQYSTSNSPPTPKTSDVVLKGADRQFIGSYQSNEDNKGVSGFEEPKETFSREKITIVPQVMLLNDQTSINYKYDPKKYSDAAKPELAVTTSTASSKPTATTTTKRPTKRPPCLRNPDSPKCIRQRKREELQRQRDREQLLREQREYLMPHYEPYIQTLNNTKRFAVSIEIPDSFKIPLNTTDSTTAPTLLEEQSMPILTRLKRANPRRRNIGGGLQGRANEKLPSKFGASYLERDPILVFGERDYLITDTDPSEWPNSSTPIPTVIAYSEPIDLNPDNCYQVEGLSYGQRRMCIQHTSIMPAISRGARSAIQECQFQFQNRRWNCSTTEDSTVFGPMTALGSPEMAFIHALAAASVTSFIARACRDGQLQSCGCSRGSRPKQLHDDWAWGGCGDNLEYAYKYATDFIDVREKEAKRGTRGAGSPEAKTDRLKKANKQQPMLADDASVFEEAKANVTDIAATKTTISQSNNSATSVVADAAQKAISNSNLEHSSNLSANTNNELVQDHKNPLKPSSVAPSSEEIHIEDDETARFKLNLQARINQEILNSNLREKERIELQEKINRQIFNSKVLNTEPKRKRKRKNQRAVNSIGETAAAPTFNTKRRTGAADSSGTPSSFGKSSKARALMNLHNNEAGRRAVIKKTRITCKCHGVSGSCSLITCWQQLSSIREIGDYLREKYEEATEVKLNKRGRLQVRNPEFKVPTAHDLVYLDESPDWCRNNRQLQWPGTHGRICNKTSSGLDGCGILCCGRGYNTKNIVVRERCNCKFHWCCKVKCDVCVKYLEEHTCK